LKERKEKSPKAAKGHEDLHILYATDFSVPAQRAYPYAALLASALGGRLVIVHVLGIPPVMDEGLPVNTVYLKELDDESKRELGRLVAKAKEEGLRPIRRELHGSPAAGICEVARETDATITVMGTHGRTGWDRLLMGSTAAAVVAQAPCPVLTVKVKEKEKPARTPGKEGTAKIKRLLVPIDFSQYSQEAFEFGAVLSKRLGARVRLVHALEPTAYPLDFSLIHVSDKELEHNWVRDQLRVLVSVLKADAITADSICEVGTPSDLILAQAKSASGDLIVMGTHGRRGLSRLALGSVAEDVVNRAVCPVVTVKCPKYKYRAGETDASTEDLYQVERLAYEIYQGRGGRPGNDVDDWLTAERLLKEHAHRNAAVRRISDERRRIEDRLRGR
jgi:nucleotide-binding universal stress UspA family protein